MRTQAKTNKRKIRSRKAKKNLWNIMWNFYSLISWALALTYVVLKTVIIMYLWPHIFSIQLSLFRFLVKGKWDGLEYFVPWQRSFLINTVNFVFVLVAVCYNVIMVLIFVTGEPYFVLMDMILVFICYWRIELPQALLLSYIGIYGPWHGDQEANYCIDTTQKHYPRKRVRSYAYYTGKTLFPSLFPNQNRVEENKDAPDIEEVPGNHCICSFTMRLHPQNPIHSFMVYFCDSREDDAFYELCSAFDVPKNIRAKIAINNSSMIIRCFDVLHRVYHRNNELTLAVIKTRLSEYSDELQEVVSDYQDQ